MLSQCIYLLNCIPLPDGVGDRINALFVNYVRGGEVAISRDRIFNKIETGGYELIDIKKLNTAVKTAWISRWVREQEYMDYAGYIAMGNEVQQMEQICVNENNGYPIINDILKGWGDFLTNYYKANGNWQRAKVFYNPSLVSSIIVQGNILAWELIFGQQPLVLNRQNWENIEVRDLLDENLQIKDNRSINMVLGVNINILVFFRLRGALATLVQYYGNFSIQGDSMEIYRWMGGIKKGCRKFRAYIDGKKSIEYSVFKTYRIPSIVTLWQHEVLVEHEQLVRIHLSLWGKSMYKAEFKDFLFRLMHGKLYLNNTVAHYEEIEPCCTFCKIEKVRELHTRGIVEGGLDYDFEINRLPNETCMHLFYSCPSVFNIVESFFQVKFGLQAISYEIYVRGKLEGGLEKTQIKLSVLHFVKYYIYQCKKMSKIPNGASLHYEFDQFLEILKKIKGFKPYCRQIEQMFNDD